MFIPRPHSPPPHMARFLGYGPAGADQLVAQLHLHLEHLECVSAEHGVAPAKKRTGGGEKEKEEGGRGKGGERGSS
eukprot:2512268-Prymnesium_polylepis.1